MKRIAFALIVLYIKLFFFQLAFADRKIRVIELSNFWTLKNSNGSIFIEDLKLPSGVYSALTSQFGNYLDSNNSRALEWVAKDNWTYTTEFKINPADYDRVRAVNLTLQGVDTFATICLNNLTIGKINNMFVQFSFNVLPFLQLENVLEIEIASPLLIANDLAKSLDLAGIPALPKCPSFPGECHANVIRKMQTSFGGRWTLAVPSMGIWKKVFLEYYEVAIIRDIDIATKSNLTHWILDMHINLSAGEESFNSELTFYAPEMMKGEIVKTYTDINIKSPVLEFVIAVEKGDVELWWPNGYGAQKLYPLFFTVKCWIDNADPSMARTHSRSISQKSLKIGFRTIELIEDSDDYGRSFYFKVNDLPIFIKGANYFPAHMFPELSADENRVKHILNSAQALHMNMIRVWGGGLYESDYFYKLADDLGLLVWQDMAFTTSTYPTNEEFLNNVCMETVQNAIRIAYHPSLAILVTNDEIELLIESNRSAFGTDLERLEKDYKKLFKGTIAHELKVISRYNFMPRPGPMLSSPSKGIEESKSSILMDTQNVNYGDVHFWPMDQDVWDWNIYPRGRFISMYGYGSMPARATWNRTLNKNDKLMDIIVSRQQDPNTFHDMLEMITKYFSISSQIDEHNIDLYIYLSQIVQAMAMKRATELYRSNRLNAQTMGALFWQFNDVNVASTSASIDFYGNYKLLYYWAKEFLAPVTLIAIIDSKTDAINITVTREDNSALLEPRIYEVHLNFYLWSELYSKKTNSFQVILRPHTMKQRVLAMTDLFVSPFNRTNCFLECQLMEIDKENVIAVTYLFPSEFGKIVGLRKSNLAIELSSISSQNDTHICTVSYSLTVYTTRPALFIYLEITHPRIINYTLSQNGFVQTVPVKTIHLEYTTEMDCVKISYENIRVQTINDFMGDEDESYIARRKPAANVITDRAPASEYERNVLNAIEMALDATENDFVSMGIVE